MRILFLAHYFPPEVNAPATRTFEHCRQWVRDGHQVTVVTCAPNHPRGVVYEGYKNRLFFREEKEGINIIRIWTYVTANEGFIKRTLNYISFMMMAILLAFRFPKTDVVISTSPQFFNGLAGYFISRMKQAPWLLEIRDLWPESIVAVGAIKNQSIIRVLEWLELFAYHKCNHIVPVTDAFKRYMLEKGIPSKKITVIKNGVDLSFYQPGDKDLAFARKLGVEGKFVVSYVGTHGMAHHLETVLEAAQQVKNPDVVFLLVGDGAERQRLKGLREEMGLENVIMVKQLPKEQMPVLWSITDVSLVLLKKSDLFKTVIPSKIFESMAMEKPVVIGVEGESREIIEAANAGVGIEPQNAAELAAVIEDLCNNATQVTELGANGRRYVAEHFDRTVLARRYENLLVSLGEAQNSVRQVSS
jgi:glycosyltransferase involved in cell wall biosynthesis